jgi:hypothetical protein
MELPDWQIIENRVDLFSKDKTRRVFVSFRNAGYIALDVPTREYFPDQVGKLMRRLFNLDGFGKSIATQRIGLRSRFATGFVGSFEDLAARFASRYVMVTEAAMRALGENVTLVDVGAPLNFKDMTGYFNTLAGPMRREEFGRYFTKDEPFPEVGLFYDIDYWKQPNQTLAERDISAVATAFARAGWDRHSRVRDLILR